MRSLVAGVLSIERSVPVLLTRIEGNNRKLIVNADLERTSYSGNWSGLFEEDLYQTAETILSGIKFESGTCFMPFTQETSNQLFGQLQAVHCNSQYGKDRSTHQR